MSIKHWETLEALALIKRRSGSSWLNVKGEYEELSYGPRRGWRINHGERLPSHAALCILRNWAIIWLDSRQSWLSPITDQTGRVEWGWYNIDMPHGAPLGTNNFDEALLAVILKVESKEKV